MMTDKETLKGVPYLRDLADECDSLYTYSKRMNVLLKDEVGRDLKEFCSKSIFNYLIIRVCVFKEELSILVDNNRNLIFDETLNTIESFEDHFRISRFKNIRNWILAHPRRRRYSSNGNGLRHISDEKKKELSTPLSSEFLKAMIDLMSNVAYELDDDLEISDSAKERWRENRENWDRELEALMGGDF